MLVTEDVPEADLEAVSDCVPDCVAVVVDVPDTACVLDGVTAGVPDWVCV